MAPLENKNLKCLPADTGVCTLQSGNQYMDNDGHFNEVCGRPDERHGYQGSFTHGVTVFRGGVPKPSTAVDEIVDHGIVLFTSSTLKHDTSVLPSMKPGTSERFSSSSRFPVSVNRKVYSEASLPEKNNAIVLATYPNLKVDTSYLGLTNIVGGRPTERRSLRGGVIHGIRRFRGGEPRDVPIPRSIDHGTVLYTSKTLNPNLSSELHIKPGTSDERQGRVGSFEHGDLHLHMPTKEEAAMWIEPGQKGGRRYGCGHYLAGASTLLGAHPAYVH